MCDECGCGEVGESHVHTHGHDHDHRHDGHTHDHSRDHDHERSQRTVVLERKVLARNDEMAAQNRRWLAERGIVALNLISSPGTGKTLLLEKTIERLHGRVPCAVIVGDQQTDRDARRLEGKGAPVLQIETQNACHLDAERVAGVLAEVVNEDTRLLFVENVGNLVCPSAFDLGENFKVALLSTTEGEDKPVKYPTLFTKASVVVLTKMDLVPHLDWDVTLCRKLIQDVHPGVFTFELSAKTGDGMAAWCDYLERLVQ